MRQTIIEPSDSGSKGTNYTSFEVCLPFIFKVTEELIKFHELY